MVLTLPQAYDTPLIGGSVTLSAGQQQRIGIARAIYGRPRVVVLDEPNANLDMAGEEALMATLVQLQRDGCTVVLVTHRTNVLQAVHKVAMIVGGKLALYGAREEVLAAIARPSQPAVPPRQAGPASLPRAMPAVAGHDAGKSRPLSSEEVPHG
jgi:ATP-binding cassette subfamily C protein EexD